MWKTLCIEIFFTVVLTSEITRSGTAFTLHVHSIIFWYWQFYTLGGGKATPLWDLQKEGGKKKKRKKELLL